MKASNSYYVVMVTAPSPSVAQRLARHALQHRLAACANIVPGLQSHYWWKGKLETSREALILFKTRRNLLSQLEREILAHHPYESPEFVAWPLSGVTEKYLSWLARELRPARYSAPGKLAPRKQKSRRSPA